LLFLGYIPYFKKNGLKSKLQAMLPRIFSKDLDAAVIQKAVSIKNNLTNPSFQCPLGDPFPDEGSAFSIASLAMNLCPKVF
jgi:hypothetical protein